MTYLGSGIAPELLVGVSAIIAALGWCVYRFIRWVASARPPPEPWGADVEAVINRDDATELCHKCLTPHEPGVCFCPHCNCAVGRYTSIMPFEYLFALGDLLRAGTSEKVRPGVLTVLGFLVVPLCAGGVLAPVYWYFFLKNLSRSTDDQSSQLPPAPG